MRGYRLTPALGIVVFISVFNLMSIVNASYTFNLTRRAIDQSNLIARLTKSSSFSADIGRRQVFNNGKWIGVESGKRGWDLLHDKPRYPQRRDSSIITTLPPQDICGFESGGGSLCPSTAVSTTSLASSASSGPTTTSASLGTLTGSSTSSTFSGATTGSLDGTSSGTFLASPTQSVISLPVGNNGIAYTLNLTVAGTSLSMNIDTGSSTFWVAASDCQSCTTYGMAEANIKAGQCAPVYLQYGIGEVSGCLTNSTIQIGDYTLSNYELLAANAIDYGLGRDAYYMSGIWGTGMNALAIDQLPTPVSVLYSEGMINAPVIGFYLSRETSNDNSQITIGDQGANSHAIQSTAVTLPNVNASEGYYQVQLDALTVGAMELTASVNQNVIIDSGTTNIILPFEVLYNVYGQILNGTNVYSTFDNIYGTQYVLPCTEPSYAQPLAFVFGGVAFNVSYSDLIGPAVSEDPAWCYGRVNNLTGVDYWILGDAFLHNVYHSVNVQTGSVTFYDLSSS